MSIKKYTTNHLRNIVNVFNSFPTTLDLCSGNLLCLFNQKQHEFHSNFTKRCVCVCVCAFVCVCRCLR